MSEPDDFTERIITIHPRCPDYIADAVVRLIGWYGGLTVHRRGNGVVITRRRAAPKAEG